jgi:hypothetical protein
MISEIQNDKSKMAMQYDTLLCAAIYKTLKDNWSDSRMSQFDGFWYGYDALSDCLYEVGYPQVTEKEMKHAMQYLGKKGACELKPTYDEEGKINGRGWFSCA